MIVLGRNIKSIRKKWGYDQVGFGEMMDCTRAQVSQYETGNNDPRIPFLIRLQDLTGISCKRLYEQEVHRDEIPAEPLGEGSGDQSASHVSESKLSYKSNLPLELRQLMQLIEEMRSRLDKLEEDKK